MRLLHTILSHWSPQEVDYLIKHHRSLDDSAELLLAYGGAKENFALIEYPQKIFLNDPCLRGPTDQQNYACWLKSVAKWIEDRQMDIQAIFFTETDHPMLRNGYGQELLRILKKTDCDFLGKWCANREGSNSYFYLTHKDDKALREALFLASGNTDSPIYEALATGMLFRKESLFKILQQKIDIPVFTEVIISSMVRAVGHKLDCFDNHCDFMHDVRYRPTYSYDEVLKLKAGKSWCCHPFKEKERLVCF